MGCFSYKCSATNLPIEAGQECYAIPMMRRKSYYGMEGVSPDYQPFALPVRGTYDDYGRVENIVRDKNVEALEAYFGGSIEAVMNTLGCTRRIGSDAIEYGAHGTLMEYFGPKIDWYKCTPDSLRALGFEVDSEGYFKHPVIQFPDGYSTFQVRKGEEREFEIFYVNDEGEEFSFSDNFGCMGDLCGLLSRKTKFIFGVGMDPETQQKMRTLASGGLSFVRADVYDEWLKVEYEEEFYGQQEDPDEIYEKIKKHAFAKEVSPIDWMEREVLDRNAFTYCFLKPHEFYQNTWCREIFDGMVEFKKFVRGLYITNGELTIHNLAGMQHCEPVEHLKYAKINLAILEKLAKRYQEVYDE